MNIADKLTQIAENMQAVYEAGKAAGGGASVPNPFEYATTISGVFKGVSFPNGYELTITAPYMAGAITGVFEAASGIKKVTLEIPVGTGYPAYGLFNRVATIEEIVFPNGIKLSNCNNLCSNCTALRSIYGAMDLTGNTSANVWNGCSSLENITFVPNTIGASITFNSSSKLSDASIQSIIDGLAEVETEQTLTLHAAVGGKLTEAQKATITAKNWTLVY